MIVDGLLLLVLIYSLPRPFGPLRTEAPGGRLSHFSTISVGVDAPLLRQPPNVAKERVREMDLSGQKAGRRSWFTTRAAEWRGVVRRFARPDLHRTALLKAPQIKYPLVI